MMSAVDGERKGMARRENSAQDREFTEVMTCREEGKSGW